MSDFCEKEDCVDIFTLTKPESELLGELAQDDYQHDREGVEGEFHPDSARAQEMGDQPPPPDFFGASGDEGAAAPDEEEKSPEIEHGGDGDDPDKKREAARIEAYRKAVSTSVYNPD